ncbi:MAG: hypothetical protein LBS09_01515 [Bacteroidales bacterium]|jgi:hypothetical protein|nr:hypothetical protein [Bacteroidales bacterium]
MKNTVKMKELMCGMLLCAAIAVSAQTPPSPIKVVLDSKDHYAHGYNKDEVSTPDAQEVTDSVMVGATMHYFVKPDADYNKAYTEGADLTNTSLTESEFGWTVPSIGSLTPVGPNTTNTSPHTTVTWNAAGTGQLEIVETPKEYKGQPLPTGVTVCPSDAVIIPVTVIPQPGVQFGVAATTGERKDAVCETDIVTNPVTYNFPIGAYQQTNISEAGGVTIKYTIKKDAAAAATGTPVRLASAATATATLPIEFDEYGIYEITLTTIADHIAVKCNLGTGGDLANVPSDGTQTFTLIVMPQPKPGPAYHYPNNY